MITAKDKKEIIILKKWIRYQQEFAPLSSNAGLRADLRHCKKRIRELLNEH